MRVGLDQVGVDLDSVWLTPVDSEAGRGAALDLTVSVIAFRGLLRGSADEPVVNAGERSTDAEVPGG